MVIPCPYCSPDPEGPKYEQYCSDAQAVSPTEGPLGRGRGGGGSCLAKETDDCAKYFLTGRLCVTMTCCDYLYFACRAEEMLGECSCILIGTASSSYGPATIHHHGTNRIV